MCTVAHGADLEGPPCPHVQPIVTDLIGGDSEWVGGVQGVGCVGRERGGGVGGFCFGGFGAEDPAEEVGISVAFTPARFERLGNVADVLGDLGG